MSERGNASLAMLGVALVIGVFILGLGDTAVLLLARARAQTAADAAALAAVSELVPGARGDAAVQAGRFAALNGARMVSCDCSSGSREAVVLVRVPARFLLIHKLGAKDVGAAARAEVELGRRVARSG